MSSPRTVLVSGATGFIALHVVDQLLAKGYSVIGTARSQSKAQPFLEAFAKKYPTGKLSYEVVPDISKDGAFDDALKNHPEVTAVLHTASPFSFGLNKNMEDAYLNPAVNGTVNMLKGIKDYAPQVTNVVVTSSFAAIMQKEDQILKTIHYSTTWNPMPWEEARENEIYAYCVSKTEAEKAARNFVKTEKVNFKLATVNPPYVLGPQLFEFSVGEVLNTSNAVLQSTFQVDPTLTTPLTQTTFLGVDVRDVAAFHILPLENEKLAEQRQFIVAGPQTTQNVADTLNEKFPEVHGKIAKGDPSSSEELLKTITPKYDISDVVEKAGGYEFIPIEKSIEDVFTQYFKYHPVK